MQFPLSPSLPLSPPTSSSSPSPIFSGSLFFVFWAILNNMSLLSIAPPPHDQLLCFLCIRCVFIRMGGCSCCWLCGKPLIEKVGTQRWELVESRPYDGDDSCICFATSPLKINLDDSLGDNASYCVDSEDEGGREGMREEEEEGERDRLCTVHYVW